MKKLCCIVSAALLALLLCACTAQTQNAPTKNSFGILGKQKTDSQLTLAEWLKAF